jgi:hypothetical protein
MKRLIATAAAILLAAAPVHAACTKPDKPKLPADGKKAKTPEMEAAEKQVQDYQSKMTAYIKCLDEERSAGQKDYAALLDQWNKLIAAYNKGP